MVVSKVKAGLKTKTSYKFAQALEDIGSMILVENDESSFVKLRIKHAWESIDYDGTRTLPIVG